MSYVYVTSTVKLPVRAVGRLILNANDETIAEAADAQMAVSLEILINFGTEKAKEQEALHEETEARKELVGLAMKQKSKSPWAMG